MYDPLTVVLIVCLYVGLLFLIALWVERRSPLGRRLAGSPGVYALALAVYCTSWTFYGSVGTAASSGMLFLPIYLGPTLMIALWWFVLRKLVRIKAEQRITSIADFISARYGKAQSLAALATVIALVGTAPYIALQLESVTATFTLMTAGGGGLGSWVGQNVDLVVVGLMILFTIIFGVRHLDPTERHEGVVTALAVESVVKLVAFLAAGVFVTYFLFNGFGDVFRRYPESAQLVNFAGSDVSSQLTWMTYLLLSMSAILFLPRQFHVAVVENADERHIRTAIWLFPLYMLLITVFVMPIAIGGLLQGYSITQADTFVLRLPLDQGQPWLALLVFIGGFSAATGMIIVSAMTIATMVTNHLMLPVVESVRGLGFLRRQLLRARWVAVAAILLLGYGFARLIGESYTLVNMGLISFAAVLQFAPAILGGLFWEKANRKGALLGLGTGFVVWAYTLFIPSFAKSGWLPTGWLENGPLGLAFLNPEHLLGLTGMAPLTHAVFWSLGLNVGAYVLGSLFFEQQEEEERTAAAFVGALEAGVPTRPLALGETTVDLAEKRLILENLLGRYFDTATVDNIIRRALDAVGVRGQRQISVGELIEVQTEIERVLAGSIGAAAASQALRQAALFTEQETRDLSGVYGEILASLRVSPEELRRRIDYYQERDELLAQQAQEMEEQVLARTRALETAADVARAASSVLDPDRLIEEVVEVIRTRFALYYVGLFLVDQANEWALLRAGTGSAGRAMRARGHKIRVGEGMVGWSIAHAEWRVAAEVGADAVRLATPELPETRSEAALPLRSRNRVLGALTVQDTHPGAFDESSLLVLQTMADQVAVALDNAHLFAETERALQAERQAYGEMSHEAWLQMIRARPDWGYRSDLLGVTPAEGDWQPWMDQALAQGRTVVTRHDGMAAVAVPLRVREQLVGALDFTKAGENATWTEEEIELLETWTEQLSVALESAQLYEDTRRRAAQDRLLGKVAARIRESLDLETILKTTAAEAREALGLPEVVVRLAPRPSGGDGDGRKRAGDGDGSGGSHVSRT